MKVLKILKSQIEENHKIENNLRLVASHQSLLELKVNARVTLTTNNNIEERLINRQMDTAKHIEIKEKEVNTIYLKLEGTCAGQIRISTSYVIAKNNKRIPVKKEETSIYLRRYKSTSPAFKRT